MRTALVLGGAASLWRDVGGYRGPIHGVVACNDAGCEWSGDLTAWVSLHPEYWTGKGWLARREANGFSPARELYSHKDRGKPGIITTPWQFPGHSAPDASITSGVFCAKVALVDLGFDRVVLCGVPLTNTPHFFDDEYWQHGDRYAKRLKNIPAEYRDRIRSMSGVTREFFGSP